MLIPQEARSKPPRGQGRPGVSLAELRRCLARPSAMNSAHRQRLLDLARRVAQVQALGDDFAGVRVSEFVSAALQSGAAVC